MPGLPAHVKVCEMGPRDGLQNEARSVDAATKIHYIDLLSESGLPVIEATSFVSPKAIPQLADAAAVCMGIAKHPGVLYPVLVPNAQGFARAREAGVAAIAVFTAASESFTKRNINMSIQQSLEIFAPIVSEARALGMWVRGYVSTCFGCPYEGPVDPAKVAHLAAALAAMGCVEISIGDTIGVGTPSQVYEVVAALRREIPLERVAMHFHDTRGTALANVGAALNEGIAIFDSSSGGLGGCPYAPGAAGNLATEDLLYLLHGMGIATGVDSQRVREASRFIGEALGRAPTSKAYLAPERWWQPAG
ncbi:hydroxymethylglutaryl-CoA lyase [bacterium]|nr:MAG: hydroxymethylglutaryl-CoA lyase [bacterium]